MATKAVVDAVLARLAEQWAACPVLTAATQSQTPGDGSPFIVVQFPVANVERMTLNQRRYREEGAFRIVILTDRNAGWGLPLTWADQLSSIFRDRTFGGIRTQVPGSTPLTDDNDDGLYNRTSFAIPFTHDFQDEG